MAFYSGKGDAGYTGLIGGERVAKESPRIEALGALDEANSALGLGRALAACQQSKPLLVRLQRELSLLAVEVAAPVPDILTQRIGAEHVAALEAEIDALGTDLRAPFAFIAPGDSPGGGALHLARATVRRAERRVTALFHQHELENEQLLRYLNRLSSLLFLLARLDDQAAGVTEPTPMR